MRWAAFAIFAFLALVVQVSLRNVLTLHSVWGISPDIIACLAVFVTLFANRMSALWACWILGLLMDLAPQNVPSSAHLIGPNALGYVFGGLMVLQLRTMVFRRRAITVGFLTLLFLIAASVVAVALMTIRSWYVEESLMVGGALGELAQRLAIAFYSGLIAIPLGWLLNATISVWNFQSGVTRRTAMR